VWRSPWRFRLAVPRRPGSPVVAGRRKTYLCTSGAEVYGEPDGAHAVWTVQARSPGAAQLAAADVRVGWY
jgi:hypothetical protein